MSSVLPHVLPADPAELPPAKQRAILVARAREDFRSFCYWVATLVGILCRPDALHHQLFCAHVQAMADGRSRRTIVTCPPGSAKSRYFAVLANAWRLGRDPSLQIGLGCHTDQLAEDFSREVQTIVRSAAYRELFPDVEFATDAVGHWQTTKGGGLYAFGSGKAIAGRRIQHLHIDDPVRGLEEATNPDRLKALHKWWGSEVVTRLTPDATVSMATTRWATRDLAGFLIEEMRSGGERWEVVELPMLCEDPARDPLGRHAGERLWADHFTAVMVAQAQRDPEMFQALYQCRPVDAAGSFFAHEWIHVVDKLPRRDECRVLAACDTAMTLGGGDYSVILVAYLHEASGNLYAVDLWRGQVEPETFLERLVDACRIHSPDVLLFDDDNAYKLMLKSIGRAFKVARLSPPYIKALPLHSGGGKGAGKQLRATAIRAAFSRGEVFLARRGWTGAVVEELVAFPGGRNDDIVDCFSLVGRECALVAASQPQEEDLVEYTFRSGEVVRRAKLTSSFRPYGGAFGQRRVWQ